MGLSDMEIPVFVNAHSGSVCVPTGVGKQEVLKAGQHLNGMRGKEKVVFNMTDAMQNRLLYATHLYNILKSAKHKIQKQHKLKKVFIKQSKILK